MNETRNLFDLAGKVAVVTGGGGGIGRAFCEALAEYGADVVCPDYYPDRAEETCTIIRKYGHKTLPLKTDISQYEEVRHMFDQVMNEFGRIDIMVNNAGISMMSSRIADVSLDDWHAIINTNVNGTFYCLKECLGIMEQQRSGVIVNIASVLGLRVTDPAILSVPPYVASKFAIVGLTQEAAAEYGQLGIRVNAIAPGWHHGTRIGQRPGKEPQGPPPPDIPADYTNPDIISRTPLGRTGDPSELKSLLLYLVADSSKFVTGQVIAHDGGWSVL